jgi:hypothetical protein
MKNPWGPKDDGPETLNEAKHWQTRNTRYLGLGLCHVCSAQAAYGHQLGFSRIHPPCEKCAPIVEGFPFPAVGPWRKVLAPSDVRKAEAKARLKAAS